LFLTAASSSTNAVSFSSAHATKRFPSPQCASATKIVRPRESAAQISPNSARLCKYYAGYGFRQIFPRAREAQPGKRYILCRIYLNCHTSCANLSNQMERPIDDLTGRKFGRWIVLPRDDIESNYRRRKWLVQCECGKLRLVPGQDLLNGRSASCGCASRRKNTHDAKTSARGLALRTRLQRVMKEVRPERLESLAKSEGVPHN
jgi:hypothetical protein